MSVYWWVKVLDFNRVKCIYTTISVFFKKLFLLSTSKLFLPTFSTKNFKEGKGTFSCERGVAGKICTARETTKQFPNPAFYANKNNGTFISELSFLRYNTLNPMNYFSLFILIFSLQLGYQGTRGSWQAPWQPMAAGSAQLNLIPRKAAPLRYQQYVMRWTQTKGLFANKSYALASQQECNEIAFN